MKVCFVSITNDNAFWGADRSLIDTIDVLRERGVEPFVIVPRQGGAVGKEVEARNLPLTVIAYRWWVVHVGMSTFKRLYRMAHSVVATLRLAWQIRRWGCDVVYTNTAAICVGAMAARLLGLPHVWHVREFVGDDHGLCFVLGEGRSIRLIDRWSDVVIANSRAVGEKFARAMVPGKMHVIHNMMRSPAPSAESVTVSPQNSNFRCVISGRVSESKGQVDAVRALGMLRQQGLDVELLIVGEGKKKYVELVESLAGELNVTDRVHFIGYVTDVFPFYRSADAVLVCSKCEAFGRVTAEAMLCGKPVVGTNTGGTPELVQENITGLLYTPGDAETLASHIKQLIDRPDWTKEMGNNGERWARENLSPERYAGRILEALTIAVASRSRHATPDHPVAIRPSTGIQSMSER